MLLHAIKCHYPPRYCDYCQEKCHHAILTCKVHRIVVIKNEKCFF